MLSITSVILAATLVNPWPEEPTLVNPWPEEVTVCAGAACYDHIIEAAAALHSLDPDLLRALVFTESRFNPKARSRAGAVGMTQLMPRTARALGVTDRLCPIQSINGGALYLRQMLNLFGGNTTLALAAYNAGVFSVIKHGRRVPPYKETKRYVKKVKQRWAAYKKITP